MSKDNEKIYDEFYDLVNMTPSELEKWLDNEKSKNVGQDSGDGEAIGHKSGHKIIKIKPVLVKSIDVGFYEVHFIVIKFFQKPVIHFRRKFIIYTSFLRCEVNCSVTFL